MAKKIVIHNPNNLKLLNYNAFVDFQGDLKKPISTESLNKLKNSLKKHGLFIPKFVWFCDGIPYVIDGHQTKQALLSLAREGWEIPDIPYVEIHAINRKDAIEKLFQINSQYAEINIESQWMSEISGLDEMLASIEIPDLSDMITDVAMGDGLIPQHQTLEKPIKRIHILLTIPTENYHEISDLLESISSNPNIEAIQSGN